MAIIYNPKIEGCRRCPSCKHFVWPKNLHYCWGVK